MATTRDITTLDEGVLSRARVVPRSVGDQFVVLVANAKGGCGKTTLSTNLASYYAQRGQSVSLLDMDPQQSSLQWLQVRQRRGRDDIQPLSLPIDGSFHAGRLVAPVRDAGTYLVIDSPAGLAGPALDALVRVSQVILVPVLPGPIDIRAATRFIQALMLSPSYCRRPRRMAVIANRARERTRTYGQLRAFLGSLKIPFLGTLRDTQLYVQAAGLGIGLAEVEERIARADQADWRTLVDWLEVQRVLIRSMPGLPGEG